MMTWLLSVFLLSVAAPCEPVVCRCLPLTLAEAAERADGIFTATVVRVREIPPADPRLPGTYEVRMRVHSSWKGVEEPEVVVVSGRTSCDIRFGAGEQYLVYGRTGPDGALYAGSCTGTRRLDATAGHLRSLGEPVRRGPGQ